jgi:hypothetical protein
MHPTHLTHPMHLMHPMHLISNLFASCPVYVR